MNFIENFKSIDWIEVATYSSILLTLIIFFYQEFSARIEGKKEVKRIVEEIVDLVIRNHASKKIGLTEVDLGYIVTGFENLKQSKLTITMSGFLKTIYAKVYTNEHITTDIRKEILRDLDDKISDMESDEQFLETENKVQIEWRKKNETLSSIICILLLTGFYKSILALEYFKNDILLTLVLIFCTLVFIVYWLKPNLSIYLKGKTKKQLTNQLAIARIENYRAKDDRTTRFRKKERNSGTTPLEIKPSKDLQVSANIKQDTSTIPEKPKSPNHRKEKHNTASDSDAIQEFLSNRFKTEEINSIKSILDKRFVFEVLIRTIYLKVYDSDTKLSYIKILSRLYNDGVLKTDIYKMAREILRSSSYVAHEGELISSGSGTYDDLTTLSDDFYTLLKKLELINSELTDEKIEYIRKLTVE